MKTTPSRQLSSRPEDESESGSGEDQSRGLDFDNDTEQNRVQKRDARNAAKNPFKYINSDSASALKALISQRNGFQYKFFCGYIQEKNCQLYKTICKGSIRVALAWKAACVTAAEARDEEEIMTLLNRLGERDIASLFVTYCQRVKGKQLVN